MNLTKSKGFLVTAFLLSLSANARVQADPYSPTEGVVRITDGRARGASRPASDGRVQQVNAQGQEIVPASFHGAHFSGRAYGDCQNGYCPDGCDPSCYGHGCHGCFGEHYCKLPPDYGYSPPAKYPLQRRGVEYTRYYPDKWYGAGGDFLPAAPMVYQPTDTTQLGFYYQHVPTWQPQPGRLPAKPVPSQWHITAPAVAPSGFCNGGNCNGGDCYGGLGHHGLHGQYGHGGRCRNRYAGFDNCDNGYGYGNGPVVQESLFGKNSRLRAMAMSRRGLGAGLGDCTAGNCAPASGAAASCSTAPSCGCTARSGQCTSVAFAPAVKPNPIVAPIPSAAPSPEIAPPVPVSPPGVIPAPPANQQKAPAPIPSARSAFRQPSGQYQVVTPAAAGPRFVQPPVYQSAPQAYQAQPAATPNSGYVQTIGYTNQRSAK